MCAFHIHNFILYKKKRPNIAFKNVQNVILHTHTHTHIQKTKIN